MNKYYKRCGPQAFTLTQHSSTNLSCVQSDRSKYCRIKGLYFTVCTNRVSIESRDIGIPMFYSQKRFNVFLKFFWKVFVKKFFDKSIMKHFYDSSSLKTYRSEAQTKIQCHKCVTNVSRLPCLYNFCHFWFQIKIENYSEFLRKLQMFIRCW